MTDRYPQILSATTGVGVVGTYIAAQITLPRADIGVRGGRRMVYELLKVWYYLGIEDVGDTAGTRFAFLSTTLTRASGETSDLASFAEDAANPLVIAPVMRINITVTSGAYSEKTPEVIDLTDQAGNGIIVATDRIFLIGANTSGFIPAQSVCKILYRIVSVPALEFIGIIQSQISGTS